MSTRRVGKGRRDAGRRRGFSIESLERRALLTATSETFVGPSLTLLFNEAAHGQNTAPAVITKMVNALESQLDSGPLADLSSGAVTDNGFITEAQSLEASFEQDLTTQKLAAHFPKIAIVPLLRLQGENVVANLIAENQEGSAGLTSSADLISTFQSTIKTLTSGPIKAIGTSNSVLPSITRTFRNELNLLSNDLAGGFLTLGQVTTTLGAEAEAYRAEVHAAIQVSDPAISGHADTKINALEDAIDSIDQSAPANASTQVASAIKTFVGSVLDTTGLFGTKGAFSKAPSNITQHPLSTTAQAPSQIISVSGTTANDGTATLTATLTSNNASPIMGQPVAFTLDGGFAGVALTNFVGVATLTEVSTTDAVGTDTNGVAASFGSNTNFRSSQAIGSLTVKPATSSITNVSGIGVYGGTDTLEATLTNATTNLGYAGQTITFSVDGSTVGTAVTNSSGLATLSGVSTINAAGTDSGGVVASFAGTGTITSVAGEGDLVISQAGTTLSGVAGAAGVGGTGNLAATLTSNVTGLGIVGETVSFTLDGTSVGSAETNSSGVATLTGVATTDGIGTDANGVVASFAGDANYSAAANVSGNFVVSENATTLSSVAGAATFGGSTNVAATLTTTAGSAAVTGATIDFTLDGKSIGTAVTNSSGVATLSGITTTDAVGTDTNGVVATFAGNSTDASSTGTGNLVVSQAGTALGSVTGTAGLGGTATLNATLTSSVTSQPLAGETISFSLDGKSVGTAVTNSSGVASLSGVATTDGAGTDSGGVVATFAGSTDYISSTATGNLVVAAHAATLSGVTGNATFGGTATLSATLNNNSTDAAISGETISFTLDGKSVGTAVTNSSGVATLAGITTTDAVGTDTNGVVATYAGSSTYTSSTATGDLNVIQAQTTLATVGGTASFGGTATLSATLTSDVTSQPLSGQTVSFTLDGISVGSASTNSSGVATVFNVATSDAVGTDTNVVVAKFAGSTDYASTTTTGNLVVSAVGTSLGSVSGTASFGGSASLTATLTNSTTHVGIVGKTIAFSLDNALVGSAVTNSSGVATLTDIAANDGVGTDTGGVTAKFIGDSTDAASNGSGNLVVSPAATNLTEISGSAVSGGLATLTATLLSSVTGLPIANVPVSFKLDGVDAGTDVTSSSGVATSNDVTTTDAVGTDTGGVTVAFAGNTDYASSDGTGDLIVSPPLT